MTNNSKSKKIITYYVTFITSAIYIIWRLFFTIPNPVTYGMFACVFGLSLWLCEAIGILETYVHFRNVKNSKPDTLPEIELNQFPPVDIFICTHNEDYNTLFRTINGATNQDYPNTVTVYVADDLNRPEIKKLCDSLGAIHIGTDNHGHAKAGNLNDAFIRLDQENKLAQFIAIFDADMIPMNNFLSETVPYMVVDDKLGFVQTPQSFFNKDIFQNNLYAENVSAYEQSYFMENCNPARNSSDSASFVGSNTLFNTAILRKVNWFATHSITEDLATGINIISKGYKSKAINTELAHGLNPDTVKEHFVQRQRWSLGNIQCTFSKYFLYSKIKLYSKLNFFTAFLYWTTFIRRCIYLIAPILAGVFGVKTATPNSFIYLIVIWGLYNIIRVNGIKFMSDNSINSLWADVVDTIQAPYMVHPLIEGAVAAITGKNIKFKVTNKEVCNGKNSSIKLAIPHIVALVFSCISVVKCTNIIISDFKQIGMSIVIYWAIRNIFVLLFSIMFYAGRKENRENYRINTNENVTVNGKPAIVSNMSESGLLIESSNFIPNSVSISFENGLVVSGNVVSYNNDKYGIKLSNFDSLDSKKEYFHILYNRHHSFSEKTTIKFIHLLTTFYNIITKELVSQ